jgi:hypothetical protein
MRCSAPIVCACAIAMMSVVRAQGPAPQPRAAAAAPSARLPVRRVVLYKNGVGYFEHVGRVRGNQSVAIDFNTAQLNDVLKSLTALDLGDGRVSDVSFNSEAPFAQRLSALTLPVGERTTLPELLGALRGARLEVRTGDRAISGRLLSVERRPRKDEAPRDELTLITDAGDMRSVELTPAVSVKLAERESAEQVSAYLGLLASNRSQDHRRMTIATVGAGARDLLVSYVSEVPVWKTTYRMVLPNGGAPVLQGWAVVDNTIGEDWNDVELSLVAGAPQSFIQPLSQPLYVQRPVVGLSRTNMQAPQVHQETLTERGGETSAAKIATSRVDATRAPGGVVSGVTGGIVGGLAAAPPPPAAPLPIDRAMVEERMAGMQASAQAQNLGDLFEYQIAGRVTIRKNQSAMVPILRVDVGVERVSVWNERAGGARPLRSLWLTNSSGLTLDGGSFTVLDGSTFAGEGLLEPIKPGEKRLLSYAVDLGVQVEQRRGDMRQRVSRIRIERGTVVQHNEQMTRRIYTMRNSDTTARTVVIEHPIRPGWTLAREAVPVETSLGAYRFAVPVEAKGVATLTVDERHPLETNYAISQLDDRQIAVFVHDSGENVRLSQALGPIQAKKAVIAAIADELAHRQAEINKIAQDQQRLRENMGALKGGSGERQLLARYLAQLNQQEDRIAVLRRESADLEQRLATSQAELAALIQALALDVEILDAADADGPDAAFAHGEPPKRQ